MPPCERSTLCRRLLLQARSDPQSGHGAHGATDLTDGTAGRVRLDGSPPSKFQPPQVSSPRERATILRGGFWVVCFSMDASPATSTSIMGKQCRRRSDKAAACGSQIEADQVDQRFRQTKLGTPSVLRLIFLKNKEDGAITGTGQVRLQMDLPDGLVPHRTGSKDRNFQVALQNVPATGTFGAPMGWHR